jgi:hypothetical protein
MDVYQAKTEANHEEQIATMKASQERMKALMDMSRDDGGLPRKD